MARTALKNMKLNSVDLCFMGANQDAKIKLYKSADGEAKGGEKRMPLWEKIAKTFAKLTGTDVDPDFMKQAVSAAMTETATAEIDAVSKAIAESLGSVIADVTLSAAEQSAAIQKSADEFASYISKAKGRWTGNEDDEDDEDDPNDDGDAAGESNEDDPDGDEDMTKAKGDKNTNCKKSAEGETDIMAMIDINKMAAEDRAILEELQKKYAGDGDKQDNEGKAPDIDPTVKKALDDIAELRKSIEVKQMEQDFAKYAIIGKKADELAAELYDLKKSNETAYNSVIAAYDELVTHESSGIFKEIGSSRSKDGSAIGRVETAAAELRKSDAKLTYEMSIIKACDENPELKKEYESL